MGKELRISEIRDLGGYEHIFVGSVGKDVIGRAALYIHGKEAEFRIHLRDEWVGKGYGYDLAKFAVQEGMKYLDRIWLGFNEGNELARKLYEKLGFKYYLHRMEIK